MATIYKVQYSEDVGFFVRTLDNVTKISTGDGDVEWVEIADAEEHTFYAREDNGERILHSDGWRASELEAVDVWRADADKLAEAYHQLAYEVGKMATGPAPVIPSVRIMMPELK